MVAAATGSEAGENGRLRILLVGWFRSIVPEAMDDLGGSQGGFVDTLAPTPYSLANACLKVFAETDPAIRGRYDIDLLNLAEPLELEEAVCQSPLHAVIVRGLAKNVQVRYHTAMQMRADVEAAFMLY